MSALQTRPDAAHRHSPRWCLSSRMGQFLSHAFHYAGIRRSAPVLQATADLCLDPAPFLLLVCSALPIRLRQLAWRRKFTSEYLSDLRPFPARTVLPEIFCLIP
jgi:hypothetical protein